MQFVQRILKIPQMPEAALRVLLVEAIKPGLRDLEIRDLAGVNVGAVQSGILWLHHHGFNDSRKAGGPIVPTKMLCDLLGKDYKPTANKKPAPAVIREALRKGRDFIELGDPADVDALKQLLEGADVTVKKGPKGALLAVEAKVVVKDRNGDEKALSGTVAVYEPGKAPAPVEEDNGLTKAAQDELAEMIKAEAPAEEIEEQRRFLLAIEDGLDEAEAMRFAGQLRLQASNLLLAEMKKAGESDEAVAKFVTAQESYVHLLEQGVKPTEAHRKAFGVTPEPKKPAAKDTGKEATA